MINFSILSSNFDLELLFCRNHFNLSSSWLLTLKCPATVDTKISNYTAKCFSPPNHPYFAFEIWMFTNGMTKNLKKKVFYFVFNFSNIIDFKTLANYWFIKFCAKFVNVLTDFSTKPEVLLVLIYFVSFLFNLDYDKTVLFISNNDDWG